MIKKFSWRVVVVVLGSFIAFSIFKTVYLEDKPTVVTAEVSAQEDSAELNGMIEDQGGLEITQYGFNWGSSEELGKQVICENSLDADKSFSGSINDLEAGITYYYQAYAENSKGSAYGQIHNFTVPINASPVVTVTSPDDNISVTRGEVVEISAIAEDDKKVESMGLYINDDSKTSVDGDSLTYDWDTGRVEPGEYSLKVTAGDGKKEDYKVLTVLIIEEEPEVINVAANDQQTEVANTYTESIPISRSVSVTDTYRYPNLSKVQGSFGQFYYRDTTGGRIEIDPNWIAENIVTITLPGLNQQVQVHKDAAVYFMTAFNYIKNGTATINGKEVPLLSLIDSMDGTFVTRHVYWDSSRGLSNHSWGIAIDINAADHYRYVDPNTEPYDPNLILWEKAFKLAGFSWGNSYSDSMHYELLF